MVSLRVAIMSVRAVELAILRMGAVALAVMAFAYSASPDDREESKSRDSKELRETARLIQAELPRWKVGMGADAAELKLDPKPILRWTNPATGRMH